MLFRSTNIGVICASIFIQLSFNIQPSVSRIVSLFPCKEIIYYSYPGILMEPQLFAQETSNIAYKYCCEVKG